MPALVTTPAETAPLSTSAPERATRRAWLLLVLLTLLNVLNFVDRQLVPGLAPLLINELGLSRAQIGLLYGFAFVIFYTAMGMVLGTMADRWNRPRLIAAGLAIWTGFTALSGAAQSFLHLFVARVFVGVGEAALTPAALSMLSDAFPPRLRASASGIYYAGVPIGAGLSLVVAAWMATHYGWRACFWVLGLLGLVFVALIALVPDVARGDRDQASRASKKPGLGEIVALLGASLRRSPALALILVGGAMVNFSAASGIHFVTWLVEERGFPYMRAGITAGLLYTVAGFVGNLLGGWFADWCHARWRGGRIRAMAVASLLFAPFGYALFLLAPSAPLFYGAWFVVNVGATAWYGPLFASVQDLTPARIHASSVAFLLLVINLLGTGPGPWITGMIGDAHSLTAGYLVSTTVGALACVPFALAAGLLARRTGNGTAAPA